MLAVKHRRPVVEYAAFTLPRLLESSIPHRLRLAAVVPWIVIVAAGPRAAGQDADAVSVPIDASIVFDEAKIAAQKAVALVLVVRADADLEQIRVRASSAGNVEIVMPLDTTIPRLVEGETATFDIPVRYGAPGASSVHFDIEAIITKVAFPFGERATLNAVVRTDRAFAGPDALVNLERRAAAYDRSRGRLRWVVILVAAGGLAVALAAAWFAVRNHRRASGA